MIIFRIKLYNLKFRVGQKWKSWTIEMLFTFCSNNKILYVILAQQTPKLPVHGVFKEDDLDYFLEMMGPILRQKPTEPG